MRPAFLTAVLCLLSLVLSAQEYTRRQYKIENGLPSDLIKAISQDSLGNLWIATDEGFVKYNAARFEAYRHITHSNYTKGFHKTRSGRLIAFADLDVFELKPGADSTTFTSLVPVATSASDTSLSYPKLVYEDKGGSMWISENQAVVRLDGNKPKRYEFELADRTPQFLRSFSFFEDAGGNLFTVSVPGNVFQYDKQQDRFVKSEYKFPEQVEFAGVLNGHLVIGARDGLFIADTSSDGKFGHPRLTVPIKFVSYVEALPNGNYFVATRGVDHFTVDSAFSNRRLVLSNVNNINHVYVSSENDIWLSTHEGVMFMQEAVFQGPAGKSNGFVESIVEDVNSPSIYYATSQELHVFDPRTQDDKILVNNINDSYFQSLVSTDKGLWAANAFQVLLINGAKVVKTFDFSDQRMFVTWLQKDARNNIWITIPGRRQALMIDTEMNLHTFDIPLGERGFINQIKDGGDGIYVVSNGPDYLFYKGYDEAEFKNISVPVTLKRGEELNTYDLFVKGRSVWLATSVGLLKYDHKTAERVNLGEGYTGMPVRSICPNGDGGFLLATPKELLYYNVESTDYNLFASSMNLAGLALNARSISITRDKRVWIGTSRGAFASRSRITDNTKTLSPQLAYANADGKPIAHFAHIVFPYNTLLSLAVTSVTFPEEEKIFEFRRSEQQPWTRLPGTSIDIIASRPGDQDIQIRARKTGTYAWSDPTMITFDVERPFWLTGWFYLLIVLSLTGIVGLTVVIVRKQEQMQKRKLEKMVEERTAQLATANFELAAFSAQLGEANKELEAFSYSVSHDLRAPLRSILGFSQILVEDYGTQIDDEGKKNIAAVQKNATKMNVLIDDLLRFSKVLHQGLSVGLVNLNEMVDEIVGGLREQGYEKTIVNKQDLPTVNADRGLVQQVWANLVSNAMKYSSKNLNSQVDISFEDKGNEYIFKVKDNGAGFDMKFAERLFGVFQRLHTDREFPGTGIGLALVRRIITRHNGRIWAEAEEGKGATFYFTLPKES